MTWIERQRSQHGKYGRAEIRAGLSLKLWTQTGPASNLNARVTERGHQFIQKKLGRGVQLPLSDLTYFCQLLGSTQAVRNWLSDFRIQLFMKARDANHEEFVQIRTVNSKELRAFEQGPIGILSLVQNPLVEG